MFYVIIGSYVILCCLVEFVYYKLQQALDELSSEWEHDLEVELETEEAEEEKKSYRSDLDFDFHVYVDKLRFGDEP